MRKAVIYLLLIMAGVIIGLGFGGFGFNLQSDISEASVTGHENHDHGSHDLETTSSGDWCVEHRVPESQCTLCNPTMVEKFRKAGDWCSEHDLPESHCRLCNPRLTFPQEPLEPITAEPVTASVFFPANAVGCLSDQAVIRFATETTATRVGLKVEPVLESPISIPAEAPADIVFSEKETLALTTALRATVIRWLVEPGQNVDSGKSLVELESPDLARIKSDFKQALADWTIAEKQWRRAAELFQKNLISGAEHDDREAAEMAARSRLEGLKGQLRAVGLWEEEIAVLSSQTDVGGRWILRSPRRASVIERRVSPGEIADEGTALALLGNPDALWIEAHVRENDLSRFRVGSRVNFSADGGALKYVSGRIIWVSQYLEPETRTGLVRAEVLQNSSALQAHQFGRMRLIDSEKGPNLLVSKEAVQWEGCCNIVFVQEAVDRYRPRKVEIGRGDNRNYAVASGLKPGDLVVTEGSFLLKTELKKESLGAGCAGE